jgi:hypothetical protein
MTGLESLRREWIERVLRFRMPPTGAAAKQAAARWQAARKAWQAANDAVDGQLAALSSALNATGDPDLQHIAAFGLNAMMAGRKTPLVAALAEIGDGNNPLALLKGRRKLLAAVDAFRSHIATDGRIVACDRNPFGVAVSIRDTLSPALERLESVVESAVGP